MMNALISTGIDHVTLAADKADVDHVLDRDSEVARGHAISQIRKFLKMR